MANINDRCCCSFISNRSLFKSSLYSHRLQLCLLVLLIIMCQRVTDSQRIDKLTCRRRPTITTAHKLPGDNGFSIKILGSPPTEYYEPGQDYMVVVNGSYTNQQFLDFMLVATLKEADDERQTAGTFTHLLSHMTKADTHCSHIMTSITFHPSYKKSAASFIWTAPRKGSGCVIFKATVVEHPDIWFSDEGDLTKMLCEKPDTDSVPTIQSTKAGGANPINEPPNSHSKRQSSQCCACDVAKYEMMFVGNWSKETHPKNFPGGRHESLLHWSDIIGASHSSQYNVWSYGSLATAGVREVCEFGWPRTLEGEIKQQGRNVRTVIKTKGIWGYPALYETTRSARFSTDNTRPFMSLLTMLGPSPDWCVGLDSVNMCLDNCTWVDNLDLELYPWDAGTDSGVTYISTNLPTYPKEKIRQITNSYPNNSASPFYGLEKIRPMATVRLRRVGARGTPQPNQRCEANSGSPLDELEEEATPDVDSVKCMVSEWSEYSSCSVTCGVGVKTRTRRFKHPMGTLKTCPHLKLQERESCLGLVNECDEDPNEPVDICITTPWSNWSPCNVSCGEGSKVRTRQYLNSMGQRKCSEALADNDTCTAAIPDCSMVKVDWIGICQLESDPGPCRGNFTRYFYDMNMKKCRSFTYGGCRGNENQFDSLGACEENCFTIMLNKESQPGQSEVGQPDAEESLDIDCMMTEWSSFSACSVSCGTGTRSRSRMIKRRNSGNGLSCPKDLYDKVVCASECPAGGSGGGDVDCMLSEWDNWSPCSVSCSDGVQVRQRMVKRPAEGQGLPCSGDRKQMRECNAGSCTSSSYSQCMLSEWAPFSECSVSCGTGKKTQRRMLKRGPCPDNTELTRMEPCEGTQCSDLKPRNCVISSWAEWTDCDKKCDLMGSQTRFRMVRLPALNGGFCEFDEPKQMEKRACYNGLCSSVTDSSRPINCTVAPWGPWSACSKTCGTGKQVRRRKIQQKRRNGGERCPPLKETQQCDTGIKCRRQRYRRL